MPDALRTQAESVERCCRRAVSATPPPARAVLPGWSNRATVQHAANELAELPALERRDL
jgi:hypothetical protein